ncbi:MAG: zinc-ribbon domain-containing protein, partial [Kofleriaceae bacterium]
MRFCPFCSAENADEQTVCTSCGRRLPPLPPRRRDRNAPPTGVQLPPRAATPPRRSQPPSNPPPAPAAPDVTVPDAQ